MAGLKKYSKAYAEEHEPYVYPYTPYYYKFKYERHREIFGENMFIIIGSYGDPVKYYLMAVLEPMFPNFHTSFVLSADKLLLYMEKHVSDEKWIERACENTSESMRVIEKGLLSLYSENCRMLRAYIPKPE